MISPPLCSRVEQRYYLTRFRIFAIHVRPLPRVTMWACQRQIGKIRLPTLRSGQDMVDLKATNLELCRQWAVFTPVIGTSDHCISEGVGGRTHASNNTPGSAVRRRS